MNEELSAKLARRLTKIELIESGQTKAFDKEDLNSSFGSEIVDLVEKKVEEREQWAMKWEEKKVEKEGEKDSKGEIEFEVDMGTGMSDMRELFLQEKL